MTLCVGTREPLICELNTVWSTAWSMGFPAGAVSDNSLVDFRHFFKIPRDMHAVDRLGDETNMQTQKSTEKLKIMHTKEVID